MYLPNKFLKDDNGNLFPIRWTAYYNDVGKYQGALLDRAKNSIFDKFTNEKAKIENPTGQIELCVFIEGEWMKCRQIIDQIKNAFNKKGRSRR